MVIFGWLRRAIVLGGKTDLCPSCKVAGAHAILRLTNWAHVFWIPVVPLWISHRLVCTNCGSERKLGWRQVRAAFKTGSLALAPRPEFKDYSRQAFEETGRTPREAEFDPVERNPRRGPWDLWLRAWPVLAVGILVASFILGGRGSSAAPPPSSGPAIEAHTCWIDTDGALAGCRMKDGRTDGEAVGREIVCFFAEPMPTKGVRCRD